MKNIYTYIFIFTIFLLIGAGCNNIQTAPKIEKSTSLLLTQSNMQLTSSAFENQGTIPSQYTCDGSNTNPELQISDVPENAKSLVLIMDDPDAVKPAGKVWDHWVVWNIPVSTTQIPAGTEPAGVAGSGTGGSTGYHGPCPPDAEHRYYFKLYALDSELNLPGSSTKAEVEKAMEGHVVASAELVGRYNRNK